MADSARELPRILVVSDDPLIREEVRYGFPVGVEVALADDARRAMEEIRRKAPSVVVVDIQTGSAGGFSLAREMAQHRRFRRIPLLMLLERHQDSWLAREAGARAFRVKPIETSDLVFETLELAAD